MPQTEGGFKLAYRGIDGYDLLFERLGGGGDPEGKRLVSTLDGAVGVIEKIVRRPLTQGERQTLAVGNELVVSFDSQNFDTYF
jgi:hypothetical protein